MSRGGALLCLMWRLDLGRWISTFWCGPYSRGERVVHFGMAPQFGVMLSHILVLPPKSMWCSLASCCGPSTWGDKFSLLDA